MRMVFRFCMSVGFGCLVLGLTNGCMVSETSRAAFATPTTPPAATATSGDIQRGETLYRLGKSEAPPCIGCHSLTPVGYSLGPRFVGFSERATMRIEGVSAADYIKQSILDPKTYVVPGYRQVMYTEYGKYLTDQDIADLVAFLMAQ